MDATFSLWSSAGFQTGGIADFQIGNGFDTVRSAGLETRDTADLEDRATVLAFIVSVEVEQPGQSLKDILVKISLERAFAQKGDGQLRRADEWPRDPRELAAE